MYPPSSNVSTLHQELASISQWFALNKLSLDAEKNKILISAQTQ